jgi:hypothetical protein
MHLKPQLEIATASTPLALPSSKLTSSSRK